LLDIGPSLDAITRAAMVASDHVVVPMAPDLYSLQGMQNLGPIRREWRQGWRDRVERSPRPDLGLPDGGMQPAGYVVLRHGIRVDRAVGPYERWLRRVPATYRQSILDEPPGNAPPVAEDPHCLGLLKHYHSLIPMGQEARKPPSRPADRPGSPTPTRPSLVQATLGDTVQTPYTSLVR
jgi:hypothetical protein